MIGIPTPFYAALDSLAGALPFPFIDLLCSLMYRNPAAWQQLNVEDASQIAPHPIAQKSGSIPGAVGGLLKTFQDTA